MAGAAEKADVRGPRLMQCRPYEGEVELFGGQRVVIRTVLPFYGKRDRAAEEADAALGLPFPGRAAFSNLYPCRFHLPSNTTEDGITIFADPTLAALPMASTENLFQAAKCAVAADAAFVLRSLDPREAASYGQGRMVLSDAQRRQLIEFGVDESEFVPHGKGWKRAAPGAPVGRCPLRSDWETAKLHIMMCGLRLKFAQPEMRALLTPLLAGDAVGPVLLVEHTTNDEQWADGGDGHGCNYLGKMLTQLLAELRAGRPLPLDVAFLRRPARDTVCYV